MKIKATLQADDAAGDIFSGMKAAIKAGALGIHTCENQEVAKLEDVEEVAADLILTYSNGQRFAVRVVKAKGAK